MTHRLLMAGLLTLAVGVPPARRASAGFVSASADGPGGIAFAQIATEFNPNDDVTFSTDYTSVAPIVFTLTVDGPGNYFLGAGNGGVTNSTGSLFPSFSADLIDAPDGSTFNGDGFDGGVFSNGDTLNPPFPNSTDVTFNGPPGLAAGAGTQIYVAFAITAPGTSTFEISLTPAASAVPEPSSLALCGVAGAAGLALARARCKRA